MRVRSCNFGDKEHQGMSDIQIVEKHSASIKFRSTAKVENGRRWGGGQGNSEEARLLLRVGGFVPQPQTRRNSALRRTKFSDDGTGKGRQWRGAALIPREADDLPPPSLFQI
jgi:hypothetical protein